MVTVDFTGRTGNHLFQYTMARIIAEDNGLALNSVFPDNDFLLPTEYRTSKIEPRTTGNNIDRVFDNDTRLPDVKVKFPRVHLHGFFQKAWFYNKHRDRIRGFWDAPRIKEKNTKDLVVHFRLADYNDSKFKCVISPLWYFDIIKKEQFEKLYIVVETHKTNERYLSYFKNFNPIIVSKSAAEDFHFIRSFDRIVCSNSTFAWWAAFLSDATKIYTLKEWMGLHIKSAPDLSGMDGAIQKSGSFYRNRQLEEFDWRGYWKK